MRSWIRLRETNVMDDLIVTEAHAGHARFPCTAGPHAPSAGKEVGHI